MKIIIAGSRFARDSKLVSRLIENSQFNICTVVCGCAEGVDRMGSDWAKERGISVQLYRPNWNMHKLAAGPLRNEEMAKNADGLILIWNGKSKGSRSMYGIARRVKLPYVSYVVRGVSNPDPGHRLYKIHREQNLYSCFAPETDNVQVDELHVLVPICNPKS